MSRSGNVFRCILVVLGCLLVGTVAAAQVEIRYLLPLWNDAVQAWLDNEAVPEFQQRYPDIRVTIEYTNWDGMGDRILASSLAGTAPDVIVTMGDGGGKQLGDQGLILPLNSYVSNWSEFSSLLPLAVELQRSNGKLYAIPNTMNLRTYAVNTDLFSRAGVDPTAPLGDWDQFRQTVQTLSGIYDFSDLRSLHVGAGQFTEAVFAESGYEWTLDENMHLVLRDSPEAMEAIAHFEGIFQATGARLEGAQAAYFAGAGSFRNGRAAVAHGEIQNFVRANDELGGVITLPEPVRQTAILPVTGLAISRSSRNPDAAWKWITFLSEPANLARFNEFYGRIPPSTSAIETIDFAGNPLMFQAVEIASRFGNTVTLSNRYGTYVALRGPVTSALNAMYRREIHPEQVAIQIETAWNALVD